MNKVSVIQGQISQSRANLAVLRSGSVVTGRVLAKNADGSYSVSLAGQKINVRSETALKAGALFSAKVSLKENLVSLSLIKENPSSEILQKFGAVNQLSPQVANLLTSLGFEPNSESFKILQFMQQLGMKFDVPEAKKALKRAGVTDHKEEKAQISLLLEEKGIKASENRVQQILGRNHERKKRKEENGNRETKSGKREKLEVSNEQLAVSNYSGKVALEDDKSLKREKNSCESVKAFFSQVDEAASLREVGLLTAFNSVLSASDKALPLRHWLLFPFEWNFRSYTGNIRLLFDAELKNLFKVVVDLRNPEKNHIFVLDYKKGELDSVKFASDKEFPESKKSWLCELLSSMLGKKIQVEMKDFDSLKGFCSGDEEFSFLDWRA